MELVIVWGLIAAIAGAVWYFFRKPTHLETSASEPVEVKEEKVAVTKKAQLSKMTKKDLEVYGREIGIELDLRKKKDDLISAIQSQQKLL